MPDLGLFDLGQTVVTPGILALLPEHAPSIGYCLSLHATGQWGSLDDEDKAANEHALQYGLRLLSAYWLPNGPKIWIITEADRSTTTILLPEEY